MTREDAGNEMVDYQTQGSHIPPASEGVSDSLDFVHSEGDFEIVNLEVKTLKGKKEKPGKDHGSPWRLS